MRSLSDLLYNFHWVVPGRAARSAQAYAGFLAPFLRRHGIKGVVNLRGKKPGWRWWDYETRVCAQSGIAHRDIAFNSRRLPTRATLLDLLQAFDDVPRPLLIKCSGGQDRTSFAAALYLLHAHGWSALAEAKRQFACWPYLHLPKRQQRWLRVFFDYAGEQTGSQPLREWIATHYRPEALRAWLEARGLGDAFRGLQATKPETSTSDDRQTA